MWKEILLAAIGATGFAVLFGIRRTRLWIIFIASSVSWYAYGMLCKLAETENIAMFLITVLIVLFSKFITQFVKSPAIQFSTPILIPFIPGSTLYYVMRDLLSGNPQFFSNMKVLVSQVGAMVLGIVVVEMLVVMVRNCVNKI